MDSEKKRSANFSVKEETLLVSLVKKYKNILECKMSDTNTNQQKTSCWIKIEKEFNAVSGESFRSEKVLRKKYDNIKKRVKKNMQMKSIICKAQGEGHQKTSNSQILTMK